MVRGNDGSVTNIINCVEARYTDQILDEYNCNPFIQALPPIFSEENVADLLSKYPSFEEKERNLEAHYRYHCVQRLDKYFQPLDHHFDLEQRISRVIRQGYLARNPIESNYAKRIQECYEAIKSGKYEDLDEVGAGSTAAGFTIIGISGMGKSTAINKILATYPQIIIHPEYKDKKMNFPYQVPWIKLDCPFDGSIKGLCINFFIEIDKLFNTNYYKKYGSPSKSTDAMLPRMAQLASRFSLGILIIDEIQHLSAAKSGGAEKMLNFFVTLVNTIGVPVTLIGTPKALSVLQGEFRQARRGSGQQGDMTWNRMENDNQTNQDNSTWKLFLEGMWEFQWTKKSVPLNQEFIDVLYDESQGIIDIAVKLFMMAQYRAIALNKSTISPAIIKKVAKDNLKLVKPMLDALRSGNQQMINTYDDIKPVDIDIDGFREAQLRELKVRERAELIKKVQNNKIKETGMSNVETIFEQIVIRLAELDVPYPQAKKSAKEVITNLGEDIDLSLAVKEAFRIILRNEESSMIKTANKKKQKKLIDDPEDLRYITSQGKKIEKDAYESLNERGYIKDPVSEFLNMTG